MLPSLNNSNVMVNLIFYINQHKMSTHTNTRILILHDYFLYKGGGERLIISMAKGFIKNGYHTEIATAFIASDAFNPRDYNITTHQLYKESRFSKLPGFRYSQVNIAFLTKTRQLMKNFDVIIYSGDCLTALVNAKGKVNIAYMHTPPRHLYDSFKDRMRSYGLLKKLIFVPYALFNRFRFEKLSKRFDLILTNAETVRERIKEYLKMDSHVVYPPCDTVDFKWLGQKDYYFSWARLYPAKRVDLIVSAFTKMPSKKLIVASGGPELEKIQQIAKGHSNIEIKGWVNDSELVELLGNSIATIYVPVREDFGMSPVESMNAGKPVIGVNEGGLKETILDGKTGILLNPDFSEKDIISAVNTLSPEKAILMKEACVAQAKNFSEAKFVERMIEEIETISDKLSR